MIFLLSSFDIENFKKIHWPLFSIILLLCATSIFILFCAAEGNFHPWAFKQSVKILIGIFFLFFFSIIPLRSLMSMSYFLYGFSFILLMAVELFGRIGMGAQRWINLGFIELQPSELMKISLVLMISDYLHHYHLDINNNSFKTLLIVFSLILFPTLLVLKQPDLGTASLLVLSGGILLFMGGLSRKIVAGIIALFSLSLPLFWHFLHEYQKQRILTFINPEQDPLGSGYHILQSKISIGSGGFWGKGFLKGTQVHLDFLPEKHTDFILTIIGEEWGYFGILILLALYISIFIIILKIALSSKHIFGKLLTLGVCAIFFLYATINIGMVTGLFPVVGVPLPFISYGGASLVSLFIAFGWVMNIHINKNSRI